MLYNVAMKAQNLTRETVRSDALAYRRCVRAATPREAIEKCLPEIIKLTAKAAPDIVYFSIFCGRKGSVTGGVWRLQPIQITRDGKFRQ